MHLRSPVSKLGRMAGISGLSLHLPKSQVRLKDWCEWTKANPSKVQAVVGDAFRVPSRYEDVYSLAANAVVNLILDHGVDTSCVGYLLFATESSTDNAVGGPTIKGLVNLALAAHERPPLPSELETFEMKQACLSGINALLAAVRFTALESDQVAIVVAADIAEYARGSSGEQTQGAGAVAMLVEPKARLIEIDVSTVGRSAADRVRDFRKPVRARDQQMGGWAEARPQDFPVFAGHYSTHCYLDTVDRAFSHHLDRRGIDAAELLDRSLLVLHHRPYEKMPRASLARMYVRRLLCTEAGRLDLAAAAEVAQINLDDALHELNRYIDLAAFAETEGVDADPYPSLNALIRVVSKAEDFRVFADARSVRGRQVVRQLGNLYSASLPAWIGAALEELARAAEPLAGREVLLIGYGSGDAALALSGGLVDGWKEAAAKFRSAERLSPVIDIPRDVYEKAHD